MEYNVTLVFYLKFSTHVLFVTTNGSINIELYFNHFASEERIEN